MSEAAVSPTGRYSRGAMILHWLIAALVAAQIGLGWYMGGLEDHSPAQRGIEAIHISIGLSVLLLTVARIALAFTAPRPPPLAGVSPLERRLALAAHVLLYVLLLILPLSGWAMESIGPRPIPFWGLAWPHLPGVNQAIEAAGQDRGDVKGMLEDAHGSPLVWSMIALVGLHVAAAIKHQFGASPSLPRMVPFLRIR